MNMSLSWAYKDKQSRQGEAMNGISSTAALIDDGWELYSITSTSIFHNTRWSTARSSWCLHSSSEGSLRPRSAPGLCRVSSSTATGELDLPSSPCSVCGVWSRCWTANGVFVYFEISEPSLAVTFTDTQVSGELFHISIGSISLLNFFLFQLFDWSIDYFIQLPCEYL